MQVACINCHFNCISLLVDKGANSKITNVLHEMPVDSIGGGKDADACYKLLDEVSNKQQGKSDRKNNSVKGKSDKK